METLTDSRLALEARDSLLVQVEHDIASLRDALTNPSCYRDSTKYTYALHAHMSLTELIRAMVEADR